MVEKLMHYTEQEIDMTDHKEMGTPFNSGGYTYACNGFIVIRVLGELAERRIENSLTEHTIPPIPKESSGIYISKADIEPLTHSCTACEAGGTRKNITCPECDGDGDLTLESRFNSYHGIECKMCEGEGIIPSDEGKWDCNNCPECKGTGYVCDIRHEENCLKVGTSWLNPIFVGQLINDFGGLVFYPPRDQRGIVPFIFDGGIGAIMPLYHG